MIDILTLPILSILNTSYLAYVHKDEINKSENKSENKVQKYVSIVLTVLTILILSILIEKSMGRLFQLLIIV